MHITGAKMSSIGAEISIGCNGAELLGNERLAGSNVIVEAIGKDWIVVRSCESRAAYSATFSSRRGEDEIIIDLGD